MLKVQTFEVGQPKGKTANFSTAEGESLLFPLDCHYKLK